MLQEVKYSKEIMNKHFKKELIMTTENDQNSQMAYECHIFNKLYNKKDIRLRDYCYITSK